MRRDPGRKATGRRYWRGLEEWADSEAFAERIKAEFPSLFELWSVDRRELLRVMGASLALAGISGCKPARSGEAVPFVDRPEGFLEDTIEHFATAIPIEGFAQPVLATSWSGRPIKLDGNPQHPMSGGASSFLTQASLLDLYDPDRSQAPLFQRNAISWANFDRQMALWRTQWAKNGGTGIRLLIAPTTSPTLIAQIKEVKSALPNLRVHLFDPLSGYDEDAPTVAFGGQVQTLMRLENARVIVSLDDDFLGPGPAQVPNARGWAKGRGNVPNSKRIQLYVAEPTQTLTGANAQHRIGVPPSRIPLITAAIAAKFNLGASVSGLNPAEFGWVNQAADALAHNPGMGLMTAGRHSQPGIQVLAFQINQRLGNLGKTVEYLQPDTLVPDGSFLDLVRDIKARHVTALFVLGANPVYASPGDVNFGALYRGIPVKVHAALHVDETALESDWHLPLPHWLEDWSDARSVDGTATIIQPVIRPLYDTRSPHTILAGFTSDGSPADARAIVRSYWAQNGLVDNRAWTQAVQLGVVPPPTAAPVLVTPNPAAMSVQAHRQGVVEIVIRPDPTIRDGSHANNGWLQELAKPLSKVTWDNVISMSPAMAERLGVGPVGEPLDNNASIVEVEAGGQKISGPAWAMPGHPDGVITVYLGYGRKSAGRVGNDVGYDAYLLRTASEPWLAIGTVRPVAGKAAIATTQTHHIFEGGEQVPTVVSHDAHYRQPTEQETIYTRWAEEGPQWAMVIDNDLCIGCNACMTACRAENNVPVVGRDQVYKGREMDWLRVSRLYAGEPDNPKTVFQPVPCMHCEQAPCEMGCPVHATVHSTDGLNLMVYNRCIGTRTCSSYCPYKVRRFNWFDYTTSTPETLQAAFNPDVTVRGRGVMEKCTYCIQRIRGAAVEADKGERTIRDGDIQTACQQACPTDAIVFGNIADPASLVAKQRASPRNYALLDELGTRPRTTYLAKIEQDEA